jgi:hypothetical protein
VIPAEKKEPAVEFMNDYFSGSKDILTVMLELEKAAFNAGTPKPSHLSGVPAGSARPAILSRESAFTLRGHKILNMPSAST